MTPAIKETVQHPNPATIFKRWPVTLRPFQRWYDRYLQRIDLSNLDDHALLDIGLSREDVRRECDKPFWR